MNRNNFNYDFKIDIGIALIGLLTLIFACLRMLNIIQWDWIWVISPFWISIILFWIFVIGFIIYIRKE